MKNLTKASADLLKKLQSDPTAQDFLADDPTAEWVSVPLWTDTLTAAEKGNLSDLKKKGLVTESSDTEKNDTGAMRWVSVSTRGATVEKVEAAPAQKDEVVAAFEDKLDDDAKAAWEKALKDAGLR